MICLKYNYKNMEQIDFQKITDNAESQMRKGTLEFAILLVISREKTYATEIINNLKEARLVVVEGTIYPLLSRLKNSGLLNYEWEESKSGPPRKYYSLTPLGNKFLSAYEEEWNKLAEAINKLKK